MSRRLLFSLLCLVAVSCTEKEDTARPLERGDCNPTNGGSHCLLPFPSSFFLAEDSSTVTGYRVDFGPTSLPRNEDFIQTRPELWNEKDGFSTLGTIYTDFPGVILDGTIPVSNIGAYLETDARTVIIDAESGERLPHWVELNDRTIDDSRKPLMLRPAVPMEHARRYVVGIRGLVDAGGLMDPPSGFKELRDGSAGSEGVEWQRAHYESTVFPALEAAGVERSELQMAFDFVTVSKENSLGRSLAMRADALSRTPKGGPAYQILDLSEDDCSVEGTSIWRTIEGTLTVPNYLTSWEASSESLLTRDASGMPYANGTADVPFTIRVPCTFQEDPRPGRLLQYGHGLLGSQSEVRTGYLSEMANRYGWVLFAVDWTGMKDDDLVYIVQVINSGMNDFAMLPERLHQSYVEFMLAGRMMTGDMASDPALSVKGTSLVDPSEILYYGNSQGGMIGGGYVAYSPDIRRAVLGVTGMPYNLVLMRSIDFEIYLNLLTWNYDDPMDVALLLGLMQQLWDPGESAGWAHFMNEQPLDETTPSKDVLIQTGLGDAQVATIGGHIMGRAYGASLVNPPVREVWGLEARDAPFKGSALVEFDFGATEPDACLPPDEETDTHELPRRELAGQEQIRAFLEDGVIENFCDGPCP